MVPVYNFAFDHNTVLVSTWDSHYIPSNRLFMMVEEESIARPRFTSWCL